MFFVRGLAFRTSKRKGRSWLLVRIAGFGNRASIATRGCTLPAIGVGGILVVELFRSKKPGFLLAATLGAFSRNSCCLRAYASPSDCSGLGGSIGRNWDTKLAYASHHSVYISLL
jgi:hypothetical protein